VCTTGLSIRTRETDERACADLPAIFPGISALEPGTLLEARLDRGDELEVRRRSYFRWNIAPSTDLTLEEADVLVMLLALDLALKSGSQ
jgi:hypothetical protein